MTNVVAEFIGRCTDRRIKLKFDRQWRMLLAISKENFLLFSPLPFLFFSSLNYDDR